MRGWNEVKLRRIRKQWESLLFSRVETGRESWTKNNKATTTVSRWSGAGDELNLVVQNATSTFIVYHPLALQTTPRRSMNRQVRQRKLSFEHRQLHRRINWIFRITLDINSYLIRKFSHRKKNFFEVLVEVEGNSPSHSLWILNFLTRISSARETITGKILKKFFSSLICRVSSHRKHRRQDTTTTSFLIDSIYYLSSCSCLRKNRA